MVRCPAERLKYAEQTKIAATNCGITSAAVAVGFGLLYAWAQVSGAHGWGMDAEGNNVPKVQAWYDVKYVLFLLLVFGQLVTFGITVDAYRKATSNYITHKNEETEKLEGSGYGLITGLGVALVVLGVIFPLILASEKYRYARWTCLCPLAGMAIAFGIASMPAEDIVQFDPNHKAIGEGIDGAADTTNGEFCENNA
jgi:hypothetical protein